MLSGAQINHKRCCKPLNQFIYLASTVAQDSTACSAHDALQESNKVGAPRSSSATARTVPATQSSAISQPSPPWPRHAVQSVCTHACLSTASPAPLGLDIYCSQSTSMPAFQTASKRRSVQPCPDFQARRRILAQDCFSKVAHVMTFSSGKPGQPMRSGRQQQPATAITSSTAPTAKPYHRPPLPCPGLLQQIHTHHDIRNGRPEQPMRRGTRVTACMHRTACTAPSRTGPSTADRAVAGRHTECASSQQPPAGHLTHPLATLPSQLTRPFACPSMAPAAHCQVASRRSAAACQADVPAGSQGPCQQADAGLEGDLMPARMNEEAQELCFAGAGLG